MASPAQLKIRRGIFKNNLVASEPFFDDNNDLLYVGTGVSSSILLGKLNAPNPGTFQVLGDITGETINSTDGATFTGTVEIFGALLINGDNATGASAEILSGSIIPDSGSIYDIGSSGFTYRRIYADTGSFGNITATAVAYSNVTGKPTLVSSSIQVAVSGASDFNSDRWIDHTSVTVTGGAGMFGGGGIDSSQVISLDTGSTHFINATNQVINSNGIISGSSQLTTDYDTRYELQGSGIWSGSEQLPSGTVSGSSQLTSSYDTRYLLDSIWQTDSGSFDSRIDLAVSGGLTELIEDTTPQLGGNLDLNGRTISGSGTLDFSGAISNTGTIISLNTIQGFAIVSDTSISASSISLSGGSGNSFLLNNGSSVTTSSYVDTGTAQNINGAKTFNFQQIFQDGVVLGDSYNYVGVDEGVSGRRWLWGKNGGNNKFQFGFQTADSVNTGGGYSTIATLNPSGSPDSNTDLIDKQYLDSITGSLFDIVNDTTPQLGGNLDLNSNIISGSGDINIVGNIIVSSSVSPAIQVTGSIEATGEIEAFASSDERLKIGMIRIQNPLDKVNKLGGYEYDWDEEKQSFHKGHDIGVSAQEVKEVLPEVVRLRDTGYLAVKYEKITPLLIEAIRELSDEVQNLKKEIKELRNGN